METFILERPNEFHIKFTGDLLASVSTSKSHVVDSNVSSSDTTLRLYRTDGEKLICERIHHGNSPVEPEDMKYAILDDCEDVFLFFGNSDLAKALYKEAGINVSIEIT